MNKKLLMSSALVGSLALASAAVAETKITGSAVFTYSAISGQTALASAQGYGSEVQIDIVNSGDLNVGGLKYKAGFSLEQDATEPAIDAREGNFFSIVSGKTEIMFNQDKAPNMSTSATPRVTTSLNTQTAGMASGRIYDFSPGAQAQQESFNTALIQGTDIGTFALVYTPKFSDTGGKNDNIRSSDQSGGSALDLLYRGNLGVKGLNVIAGHSKLDGQTGNQDTKTTQVGIGYNFGQIAVGVTKNDTKNPKSDTGAATAGFSPIGGTAGGITVADVESYEYGITFAANDNLSFGIQYAVTDSTLSSSVVDEEITSVAAAYNLGGAALELYYVQIENIGGARVADVEKAAVRLTTKF